MRSGGRVVFSLRFSTFDGAYVRCSGAEYIDVKGIIDGAFEINFE
jgi:hypothetical protein